MHTEEHVVGLFAAANPVKESDVLDPIELPDIDRDHLARVDDGWVDIQLEGIQSIQHPRRRRPRPLLNTQPTPDRSTRGHPWLIAPPQRRSWRSSPVVCGWRETTSR
jgi:hypothetical protein